MSEQRAPEPFTADQLIAAFPPRKVPTQPSLMAPGFTGPVPQPTLAHLANSVAALLGDRRPVITRGVATFLGYDTFPVFTVHGENIKGLSGLPCSASYVCSVAIQDTPAERFHDAIVTAQARVLRGAA